MSRSSAESEDCSMANTTREIIWLLSLLLFGFVGCSPWSNSHFLCTSYVANSIYYEHTKHIEIDCHIVREKIQVRLLKTLHVTTHNQLANIFIKALHPSQFHVLLGKMRIHYSPS